MIARICPVSLSSISVVESSSTKGSGPKEEQSVGGWITIHFYFRFFYFFWQFYAEKLNTANRTEQSDPSVDNILLIFVMNAFPSYPLFLPCVKSRNIITQQPLTWRERDRSGNSIEAAQLEIPVGLGLGPSKRKSINERWQLGFQIYQNIIAIRRWLTRYEQVFPIWQYYILLGVCWKLGLY